ncbi:MAG: acetyl-CoA C-acetyltransferase [Rhodobacteraceae bacterium]|nr:acetyl-CoA C-acetyltransferase [Paracoccaceae bacterium]
MSEALIFDAVRTPRGRGRPDGALHTASPLHLATTVLDALRNRNAFDAGAVEDVVMGCAETANDQGANIARSAALTAGYPDSVGGCVVSRFCGSGLEAVNMAAARLMAGQADMMVAGGVEMMSLVPMLSTGGPIASDTAFNTISWLTPQGISADLIATLEGHSRAQVDAFAAESQVRADEAIRAGRFDGSLVPVHAPDGAILLDREEYPRPGTTAQTLAGLKPAFAGMGAAGFGETVKRRYPQVHRLEHVHHAGNSSGIVDGAAALLLGTEAAGRVAGLRPRGRILSFAAIGSEPSIMLTAPAEASARALRRAGLGFDDIDLFEVNEAFASVVLYFMDRTGVPHDKVNVNGGAIALGHPIGATGAILAGTLLDELERREARYGLVTMCVGLGMGVATVIERLA